MTREEALPKLLHAYSGYYNVNTESPASPFAAEAEFRLHDEQYFLIRSARISEADAKEFVYFASVGELTPEVLAGLDQKAWELGIAKADPGPNQRSADVALIILCDRVPEETARVIRKNRRVKSYKCGFRGYSHYRLLACEPASGRIFHNRMGEILKKTISAVISG